jgi:hypothetical protein
MSGYHNVVFLSDQPDLLVTAYRGGHLIDLSRSADEEVLAFYRRGHLLRSLRLAELVERPTSLPRQGRFRRWFESMGFSAPDRFSLRTGDGRLFLFDATNGRTISVSRTLVPPAPLLESP